MINIDGFVICSQIGDLLPIGKIVLLREKLHVSPILRIQGLGWDDYVLVLEGSLHGLADLSLISSHMLAVGLLSHIVLHASQVIIYYRLLILLGAHSLVEGSLRCQVFMKFKFLQQK